MITHPDKKLVQEMFFVAMCAGYAGGAQKTLRDELPGGRIVRYVDGPWIVHDEWVVTPHSDKSFGQTVITHDGKPVWMMQYAGAYPQTAIPFLKESLRRAYERQWFIGGRGPIKLFNTEETLRYQNDFGGSFPNFEGREEIQELPSGTPIGWHRYYGMLLF